MTAYAYRCKLFSENAYASLWYTVFSMASQTQTNRKLRTYARNRPKRQRTPAESDSTYFLKLVIYVLLGTFWIKFAQPIEVAGVPFGGVPLGMMVGILIVSQFEKNQANRKIWYAVLLVITIISHFVPAGIVI